MINWIRRLRKSKTQPPVVKPGILYLCDRRACPKGCSETECRHTTNINHAVNFKSSQHGKAYIEEEKDR